MTNAARAPHPDFDAAPENRRWRGGLRELRSKLDRASDAADGGWAGVVLPGGAHVGMRSSGGRRELMIYRTAPFATEKGPSMWAFECSIFRREFGCNDWDKREPEPRKDGGPSIIFVERTREQDFFEEDDDA